MKVFKSYHDVTLDYGHAWLVPFKTGDELPQIGETVQLNGDTVTVRDAEVQVETVGIETEWVPVQRTEGIDPALMIRLRVFIDRQVWNARGVVPERDGLGAVLSLSTGDNTGAGMDEAWRLAWWDARAGVWRMLDCSDWALGDTLVPDSAWLVGWRELIPPPRP